MKKIQPVPHVGKIDPALMEKILSDPEKMEEISRFNREYYHWDELRYRVDDKELKNTWALMKFLRKADFKQFSLCGLDLKYSLLYDFQEALHLIDCNSAGLTDLYGYSQKDAQVYAISSVMEEAIASSQMEGAVTTRKEAKQMLRSQREPKNTSEKMILNNYLAMKQVKSSLDRKMTVDLILKMHKTVTSGILNGGPEWEGRFREDNETVVADPCNGVVFHVPPSYDKIPSMMQELCDFINRKEKEFVHPIIKGIIIHYLVGYIHPFVDGNGRMARSLFYWFVLKNGYPLMEYTSISRIMKNSQAKYGLAYQYTETDDYDLTYFIRFNLNCIVKAVSDLRIYIKKKNAEQKQVSDLIKSDTDLSRDESMILIDYTRSQEMFSVKEISTRYNVSYQTARNYVTHLCELGYLKITSRSGKTRLYTVQRK